MNAAGPDPKSEWERFRPTAYGLDPERVYKLPVIRVSLNPAGHEDETPTTLGEVLASLADQQVGDTCVGLRMTIGTAAGETLLRGPLFNHQVLEALLELRKDGIEGFEAQWFWYKSAVHTYSFFLVHNQKIVRERMSFINSRDSGFDPSVFKELYRYDAHRKEVVAREAAVEESRTIPEMLFVWMDRLFGAGLDRDDPWFVEDGWVDAEVRFWYRKFYQETQTGQIIVLRSDEPLYYYPEGRWRPDVALRLLQNQLRKTNSAVWLLVFLAMVAVILLWRKTG
jgi:hypothetical protein